MTAVPTTSPISEAAAKFVIAKVSKAVDSLTWLSRALQVRNPAVSGAVAGLAEEMAGITTDALQRWPGMSGEPDRLIDKVVGWAIGLLVASIALYGAVAIIGMIWSTLVLILGGGLILAVLVAAWRSRSRGW